MAVTISTLEDIIDYAEGSPRTVSMRDLARRFGVSTKALNEGARLAGPRMRRQLRLAMYTGKEIWKHRPKKKRPRYNNGASRTRNRQ